MPQAASTDGSATATALFARSGEYWNLRYGSSVFSLKDSKGLLYIQCLLRHPGRDFHSLELMGDESSVLQSQGAGAAAHDANLSIGRRGDAGPMLDARAKQEYRRRRIELTEELEELKQRGDHERAAAVEEEIDFLLHELARAVGLRGRDRHAGSDAERARLNVTRAIKGALQRISEHNAPLGEMLTRTIKTGTFCCYTADPALQVQWRFSLDDTPATEPVETAPPAKREPVFARALVHRTGFVGREAERAALDRCLEQARRAEGGLVMISGSPGVGKTRLADETGVQAVGMGFLALAGGCYDRKDSAPFTPFIEILEAAMAQARTPQAFVDALGADAAEVSRLLPQLRRIFPGIPQPLETAPEQSRRLLFAAVAAVLTRTAKTRPVLLLIEDIHWADEGSLSLLGHLARMIFNIPVLIVATCRDHEIDPGGPLAALIDDLTRRRAVRRIALEGLPISGVGEIIRELSGREPPQTVVDFIYAGTEGNPFFVEELFLHLLERGKLTDSRGEFRSDLKLTDIDVPQTLRLVIGRRLARLGPGTIKSIGIAAVIGPSFSFDLLEAASGLDADKLLDEVEEAERAGLLSSLMQGREARFQFAHELIRQSVLSSISEARRQRLHLQISQAIERLHGGALEDVVVDLAAHLWQAGDAADPAKTVEYLRLAARRAKSQSANEAALAYLQDAMELVGRLPRPDDRDAREMDLLLEYLPVIELTNRWTTTEAGSRHTRARNLSERLGQQAQRIYRVLQGSATYHLGRGEYTQVQECARQILELSRSASGPQWALSAHYFMGHAMCCLGDQTAAHRHFTQALQVAEDLGSAGGEDAGVKVSTLAIDSMALWISGHVDLSKAAGQRCLAVAEESANPFHLVFALVHAHIVAMFRREYSQALEIADRAMQIAAEKKFQWIETSLAWSRDACRIRAGLDKSIDQVHSAFKAYFASEAKLYKATNCTVLAECCEIVGQAELGLSMIQQAFAAMADTGERLTEPETWRVKGLLLLKQASAATGARRHTLQAQAESSLRKALEVAPEDQCASWKLRAALSLSGWLMDTKRAVEARELVSKLYRGFTEGLETPDLQTAAKLLRNSEAAG